MVLRSRAMIDNDLLEDSARALEGYAELIESGTTGDDPNPEGLRAAAEQLRAEKGMSQLEMLERFLDVLGDDFDIDEDLGPHEALDMLAVCGFSLTESPAAVREYQRIAQADARHMKAREAADAENSDG